MERQPLAPTTHPHQPPPRIATTRTPARHRTPNPRHTPHASRSLPHHTSAYTPSSSSHQPPSQPLSTQRPDELTRCLELLHRGRLPDAFAVAWRLLAKDPSAAQPLVHTLLSGHVCLDQLSTRLGRAVVASVASQLDLAAKAEAAQLTASAEGGYDGGGDGGAAGGVVPTMKLLAWLESALMLRRRGVVDLLADGAAQPLAWTLHELSASPNAQVGVQTAKLFALLSTSSAGGSVNLLSKRTPQRVNAVRSAADLLARSAPAAARRPASTPMSGDIP